MNIRRHHWLLSILALMSLLTACTSLGSVEDGENTTTFEGPPDVSIASPLTGDSYEEGVNVSILVRVTNAGEDIGRVALQVDGQIIAERTQPNPDGVASFVIESGWIAAGNGQHTISAVASRLDGVTSNNASVTINVIGEQVPTSVPITEEPTPEAVVTEAPTATNIPSGPPSDGNSSTGNTGQQAAQPTNTPQPSNTPTPAPTNTPSQPRVRVDVGANVRGGPGTVFGPIGSLAAGDEANILAVNPDGSWYKIQYYNGEGWIFGDIVTILGDTSRLPREVGPPTPVPFTATPVPPTAAPTSANAPDISAVALSTNPNPPVCNQDIEVFIRVANSGTGASTSGGRIVVEDVVNGVVQGTTETVFPELAVNAAHEAYAYFTISTFVAQQHTIRVRIDADNQVAESNENNNTRELNYTLATGGC